MLFHDAENTLETVWVGALVSTLFKAVCADGVNHVVGLGQCASVGPFQGAEIKG